MSIDPSKLKVQIYPAAILRKKAAPVERVDDQVRAVIARMFALMREEEGIGLAAPQVGLSWRLFVVDIPAPRDDADRPIPGRADGLPVWSEGPRVYINPRLSQPAGNLAGGEEGCLSLPDIRGEVVRPPIITITALDIDGREFTTTGAGLLARCWQHEMDHLDGVLIIDRMTQLSRLKNRVAIRDLERDG